MGVREWQDKVVWAGALSILLAVSQMGTTRAAFSNPTISYGNSDYNKNLSPLKDFSFLVTFSETVQQGPTAQSIQVTSGTASTDVNRYISCATTKLDYQGKKVFVPVTDELKSYDDHTVKIPSTCFKNLAGEVYSTGAVFTYSTSFKTITKGSSILSYDVTVPTSYDMIMPADISYVTKKK